VRRSWLLPLFVLAVAALSVGAAMVGVEAWAGLYPRSALLARACAWPLVGDWIATVRQRHLGPPAAHQPLRSRLPPATPPPPPPPVAWPGLPDLPPGVWPEVWLTPGDRLRARPAPDAAVVLEATVIANVRVLEARGDWRRVSWRGVEGWVKERPLTQPPLGSEAEPVLPLPGRPPDPELLSAARALLAGGADAARVDRRVGPYPLLTDVEEPALLLLLDRAAAGVETAYRERYGLVPVGTSAEAVVLFRSRAAYEEYVARTGGPRAETGHVSRGVVALYRQGRLLDDVRTTLVHELVHVLSRRALGPALPPWLDEGMADDIAESRIGEGGRPLPGTLGGTTLRQGVFSEVHGGEASRDLLRRELASGNLLPLETLTGLDFGEFHGTDRHRLVYAESSSFVRYLLAGELAAPFRAFLRDVSQGTPPTPQALQTRLRAPWPVLDAGLARFLTAPPPEPTPSIP
jgi:hypothetical protein